MTNLAKKVIKKAGEYKFPLLRIVAGSVLVLFLFGAIFPSISPDWTGFGPYGKAKDPRAKTLWDWMELLIIPVALAFGVWWFNKSERETERKIAVDRIRADGDIAEGRQQEQRLQTYFDRMTELLLKEKLLDSEPEGKKRSIARTRTLSTLRTLNGERKGFLLRFLCEAKLIKKEELVVDLTRADLNEVDLREADLREAHLSEADLSGAYLSWADLSEADLSEADLIGAHLNEADLREAHLTGADLTGADLTGAKLTGAKLTGAELRWATLTEATVTVEQLAEARALEDATMPDGTKYEEWVKSHPEFLEMRDKAAHLQGMVGSRGRTEGADDDTETS